MSCVVLSSKVFALIEVEVLLSDFCFRCVLAVLIAFLMDRQIPMIIMIIEISLRKRKMCCKWATMGFKGSNNPTKMALDVSKTTC